MSRRRLNTGNLLFLCLFGLSLRIQHRRKCGKQHNNPKYGSKWRDCCSVGGLRGNEESSA
ncbi:hypothetical protein GQ43DRAFT_442608, partial [Delitschia confertaspora ATCC 74209]